jgi:hypothetical protein
MPHCPGQYQFHFRVRQIPSQAIPRSCRKRLEHRFSVVFELCVLPRSEAFGVEHVRVDEIDWRMVCRVLWDADDHPAGNPVSADRGAFGWDDAVKGDGDGRVDAEGLFKDGEEVRKLVYLGTCQ